MENYTDALSLMVLLSSFILVANKRITSYIRTFRIQSFLIALTAGIMGIENLGSEKGLDLLIVCTIIFLLKVIYIPRLMHKTYAKVEYRVEKDFFLNIPILVLISLGLVVFSYYTLSKVEGLSQGQFSSIINSVSVVFIGLLFMVSRKKAIGQIIGFLVIENGLFITAMLATQGMPLIVDLGIFIDLITAVLIMGVMVFRISERFETIDINKLKKLRG